MNFLSAFLTPAVINAVLRHVVTAGAVFALTKGWVDQSTLATIATTAAAVIPALTAGASSTPAAVAKQTAKNNLVAVPAHSADPTWADPNAR